MRLKHIAFQLLKAHFFTRRTLVRFHFGSRKRTLGVHVAGSR